jgi:flagellar biosynthesis/type III secretory pathway M-ring protein FliF/YscJ
VYGGGWWLGYWIGNFALLLFVLTVVTLVYWLAERFYFLPRRRQAADALAAQRRRAPCRTGQDGHAPGRGTPPAPASNS